MTIYVLVKYLRIDLKNKFSNLLLKYIGIYVIIRKYGRINKKNYIIEN